MQDPTERSYVTSEQHKELSASQLKRDEIDLRKVAEKLDSVTPFSTDESFRNIITGINANEGVNMQDLFKIRHCTRNGRTIGVLLLSQTEFECKDSSIQQEHESVCRSWHWPSAPVSEVSRSLSDGKSSVR